MKDTLPVDDPQASNPETLPPSGPPPESRLGDISKCRILVQNLLNEAYESAGMRLQIKGLIDGLPPYDQAMLDDANRGWQFNVNFRGAEARKSEHETMYWDLLMQVPRAANITVTDWPDDEEEPESGKKDEEPEGPPTEAKGKIDKRRDYGAIIADKYNKCIENWDEFTFYTMLHQSEMVTWGSSSMFWRDEFAWKSQAMWHNCLLVPEDTLALAAKFEFFAIRDRYTPYKLYEEISKPKAEQAGWNIEACRRYIIAASKESIDSKLSIVAQWELMEQRIKNNQLYYSATSSQNIYVCQFFCREFNGRWTHAIVLENARQTDEYLFRRTGRFECVHHILSMFYLNIGDGYHKSVKGIGPRMYYPEEAANRLLCRIMDGGDFASSLVWQASTPTAMDDFRLTKFGPVTILPPTGALQSSTMGPNIAAANDVRLIADQITSRNLGRVKANLDESVADTSRPRDPENMRQQALGNARINRAHINLYYRQWDVWHKETLRRLLNPDYPEYCEGYEEANEFRESCIEAGVPEELLECEYLNVKAYRAIGYGSSEVEDSTSRELLAMAPMFDVRGKQSAIMHRTAHLVGYDNVGQFVPEIGGTLTPTQEDKIAALENNDLREATDVPVYPDEPHFQHVKIHATDLIQEVQVIKEGSFQGDPRQLYGIMAAQLKHFAQHVDFMETNPLYSEEAKQANQLLKVFIEVFREVEDAAKKASRAEQMQMQQQQQAVASAQAKGAELDLGTQLKLKEVQADFMVKMQKEQNTQSIREAKAAHIMSISERKFQQKAMQDAAQFRAPAV